LSSIKTKSRKQLSERFERSAFFYFFVEIIVSLAKILTKLKTEETMEISKLSEAIEYDPDTLTKKILFQTKETLCFVLNLLPGQTIPAHRHERSILIVLVVRGAGDMAVNRDTYALSEGSVFMIAGEDDFAVPKVTKDLSLFVTLSPNPQNPAYAQGIG
jgi:quercetin dioxygenase-like cupin family protein